jgi:hypothetical protein
MAKRLDRRLEMRAAVRNANWRRLGAEQKAEKPPIGEEEAACWLSVFGVGGRRLLIMVAHPPELLVARGEPTFRSGYAELSALICAGVLLTAIERTFGFNCLFQHFLFNIHLNQRKQFGKVMALSPLGIVLDENSGATPSTKLCR